MSWIGLGNPSDKQRMNLIPQLVRPIERIIGEIEHNSFPSRCCLCGVMGKLSNEHTPSKKAANTFDGVSLQIDDSASRHYGKLKWLSKNFQGGVVHRTLCEKCNNMTGGKYNPEYIRFARTCLRLSKIYPNAKSLKLDGYYRLSRIAKQALTTIVATCSSGLTEKYPEIRELLCKPEQIRMPGSFRLHMYLMINWNLVRITGLAVTANLDEKVARLVAEFAFKPLGWVLTFDVGAIDGAIDVTDWLGFGYDARTQLNITVPRNWIVTAFPLDFRHPSAITGSRSE